MIFKFSVSEKSTYNNNIYMKTFNSQLENRKLNLIGMTNNNIATTFFGVCLKICIRKCFAHKFLTNKKNNTLLCIAENLLLE